MPEQTKTTRWAIVETVRKNGATYEVTVLPEGKGPASDWLRFGKEAQPFTVAPQAGQQVIMSGDGTRVLPLADAPEPTKSTDPLAQTVDYGPCPHCKGQTGRMGASGQWLICLPCHGSGFLGKWEVSAS